MPQWDGPLNFPYSIYACERPYDQAPALTKCDLHEPLKSPGHIRLLKLFPPGWPDRLAEKLTREEDTNIQCEIYQVPLASITTEGRPYFATLSYAWGDPKPAKQIRCGRALVFVAQSLHDALVYIRNPRKPRLVWVDCLCIDQSNTEEKSRQVQRMHLVYGMSHCIAWLGVESDPERDLTAMLPILSWFSEAFSFVESPPSATGSWHNVGSHFKSNPIRGWSSLYNLPWAALHRCLNRDIFSRLWCVQETILARSNDLRTSISHLNITVLARSCNLLAEILEDNLRNGSVEDIDSDVDTTKSLLSRCTEIYQTLAGITATGSHLPCIRYTQPATGNPWKVASTAATAMRLYWKECSDPRDRIYGLAGLCNFDASYQISYSKETFSVQQIFVDFTLHCLKTSKSLELFLTKNRFSAASPRTKKLHLVAHRNWLHGLPSWCPDFAGPQGSVRNLIYGDYRRTSPLEACKGRPAYFTLLSRRCVGVVGVYIGVVRSCSSDWRGGKHNEDLSHWTNEQPHGVQLWKLYLDVCSTGLGLRDSQAWYRISKFLPARTRSRMVKSTIGAAWIMKYAPEFAPKDGLALSRKFDDDTWSDIADDVDCFLHALNHGTRLFTTDNSAAWLGTGLGGTRVGDVVCVLSGGDVPFILRQVGNKGEYKLIGECYVAGIMHGEALDMGLEEREFRLI